MGHTRTPPTKNCTGACATAAINPIMAGVMPAKERELNANAAERAVAAAATGATPALSVSGAAAVCPNGGGSVGGYPCLGMYLLSVTTTRDLGMVTDANDIWGWTDPMNGNEVVIIGAYDRTSFVLVTDPVNPVVLGHLMQSGTQSRAWSDAKVYSNHAYIVRESSNHGVQVFDLTQLRQYYGEPSSPGRSLVQTAKYENISAHNIVINEETGFAYVVGAVSTFSGGLHAIDLSTPGSPTYAGGFGSDGYTHDAQCIIYAGPDVEHRGKEICVNANEDTVTVVDMSDKANPVQISRTGYSDSAYTHQAWLTEDHAYLLLNDELDEKNLGLNGVRQLRHHF